MFPLLVLRRDLVCADIWIFRILAHHVSWVPPFNISSGAVHMVYLVFRTVHLELLFWVWKVVVETLDGFLSHESQLVKQRKGSLSCQLCEDGCSKNHFFLKAFFKKPAF